MNTKWASLCGRHATWAPGLRETSARVSRPRNESTDAEGNRNELRWSASWWKAWRIRKLNVVGIRHWRPDDENTDSSSPRAARRFLAWTIFRRSPTHMSEKESGERVLFRDARSGFICETILSYCSESAIRYSKRGWMHRSESGCYANKLVATEHKQYR